VKKIFCPKKEPSDMQDFNIEILDEEDIVPIAIEGPILLDFEYSQNENLILDTTPKYFYLTNLKKRENGILEIEIETIDKCYSVYRGLINRNSDSELNLIFKEDIGKCDEICNLKLKYIIDPKGIEIKSIKINDYKILVMR
jgi:hypothetical protein